MLSPSRKLKNTYYAHNEFVPPLRKDSREELRHIGVLVGDRQLAEHIPVVPVLQLEVVVAQIVPWARGGALQ